MKRKVVQIAGFTKVISLPSEWVKHNGVNKGDELDVKEDNGHLIISSGAEQQREKAVLDLTKTDRFLRRFIDVYYRLGYDELDINLPDDFMISKVQQEVSQRLLGFEIVEQKKNFCKVKSISNGVEEEFEIILRRIFMMLVSMSKEGVEIMMKKDYPRLETLIPLEEINNKFTNFCQRHLNKHGHPELKRTTMVYHIVTELENIADSYAEVFKTIKSRKEIDPKILELYRIIDSMLYEFYMLFYDFKIDKLIEFDRKWKQLIEKDNQWFKPCKTSEDNYCIYHLHTVARRLHHLTENVY